MSWIDLVAPADATGRLKRLYDAAVERAGRVFNVVALQSRQPLVLDASTRLYVRIMKNETEPLTKAQREMIATLVSRVNGCHY